MVFREKFTLKNHVAEKIIYFHFFPIFILKTPEHAENPIPTRLSAGEF